LYFMGVCYMFIALAIVCDEFFVPALEVIVEKLDITPDVAGATFMAAGGSAPELCTSFIGTFISKSSVGFGTIVGSAVFNVLFVIAMCAIFSKDVLTVTGWPLARDCSYYAFSLIMLSLFFGVISEDEIAWWEALILFGMYFGYVILMKYNEDLRDKLNSMRQSVMGPDKKDSPGDVEIGGGTPEEVMQTAASATRRGSESEKVSTFRAGISSLLMHNKEIVDTAGLHVVARIRGDVKTTFKLVDKDGSGYVDQNELSQMLEGMGWKPTEEELNKTMKHIDRDRDGKISFEEFAEWYAQSEERVKIEILEAFVRYDTDASGYIDQRELHALLCEMHGSVSDELVSEVMSKLDADKDGKLSKDEFSGWYCQTEFFHHRVDAAAEEAEEAEGLHIEFPDGLRARVVYLCIAPITHSLYFTLPNVRKSQWRSFFPITFCGSIIWIGVYSYFMVWWAEACGNTMNIPPSVMGLTILAAGTSIPDLLTSVIVAKQGEGDMAVSSSIGSNIFDVLVGLPFPWLVYTMANGENIGVEAGTLFLSVLILLAMLVSVIVIISLSEWKLTRKLAGAMVSLYFLYIAQDLLRVYCIL